MNTTTLIIVSAFLIIILVAPVVGIIAIVRDIINSRRRGRELDELKKIADSIVIHLQLLRENDAAEFKATFSNWLERFINLSNQGWVQMNARFILEAQAIALGESSRDKLQYHEGYRQKIIRRTFNLSKAMNTGDVETIMHKTGDLIALVLSSYTFASSADETINPVELAAKTMQDCSRLITKDIIAAENKINDTFRKITEKGGMNNLGVPLMVLKWSQISIKDISGRSFRKSITFSRALKEVSWEFGQAANLLRKNQMQKLARLIYEY